MQESKKEDTKVVSLLQNGGVSDPFLYLSSTTDWEGDVGFGVCNTDDYRIWMC